MSSQQPRSSGFGSTTTARDVISSFKTIPQGAATTVWCATSPQLAGLGGVYCENCDIAPIKTEGDDGVRPYAVDPAVAQRLWAWSERWL
jgi:hypothetical protein